MYVHIRMDFPGSYANHLYTSDKVSNLRTTISTLQELAKKAPQAETFSIHYVLSLLVKELTAAKKSSFNSSHLV